MPKRKKPGPKKKRGPAPLKPRWKKRGDDYILVDPQILSWQAKRREAKRKADLANPDARVHKQFKSAKPPTKLRNIFTFDE